MDRDQMTVTLMLLGWVPLSPLAGNYWMNAARQLFVCGRYEDGMPTFDKERLMSPAHEYMTRLFADVSDRNLRDAYVYLVTL